MTIATTAAFNDIIGYMADSKFSTGQFLGVIVLIIIAFVFFFFSEIKVSRDFSEEGIAGKGTASLTLDFGGARKRIFQGPVIEDMTVLQALQSSQKGGKFEIRYSSNSDGTIDLATINGQTNGNGNKKWHFYLNGKALNGQDLNRTIIKESDLIEAKFE